jgi:LVIVD repeat
MRRVNRPLVLGALMVAMLTVATGARADHATRPHTPNIHAEGHSPHVATFEGEPDGVRHVNSDIAFQGELAFNGNYDGWRVIDISDPDNPTELAHPSCNGDQGDIVVYRNILVRSWNSKKTTPRTCLGTTVPAGWEGVHVFDISDPVHPELKAAVELPCGSHTVTLAGVSRNRLIVYSNISSSTGCGVDLDIIAQNALGDFMDVIAVPLDDLAGASLIHREPLAGPTTFVRAGCHDAAVIRGAVNLAACASADTANVFSVGAPRGGSIEDPQPLYTITEPGVGQEGTFGRWHSAAFTWDGKVLVLGWEPGGGGAPFCTENGTLVPVGGGTFVTQTDTHKSAFFYDTASGNKLGQWVLPRPQTLDENCTIHNYNVVPLRSGRYVLVSGNYQAGTWVTDFTDPAHAATVAWSDPPALGKVTTPTGEVVNELGGAWSSYWYNDFIYESEITKGLNVFSLSDKATTGAIRLGRLNPQTAQFSIP